MGRDVTMPRARWARVALGVLLVLFGLLGFLPVLGFWMMPLGLLVLSYEFALFRRLRRRLAIWWGRRGNGGSKRAGNGDARAAPGPERRPPEGPRSG
ncbi:hypothetical protein N1F89_01235 [Aquibium sp. A9E412]|uniref:hypothetical protein n=1 Tax=Aquibium sp. A9E412 TaxID=2976767 RepID=UPI0025B0105B|nr:hypothetical protein [Aquibium sp. A9E412]MDN2564834.1 hypothetical protein [Aquibium sp. A9E412]